MKYVLAIAAVCYAGTAHAASPAATPDAAAFVHDIYAGYTQSPAPDRLDKLADVTFAPALLKAIRADQKRNAGDALKLDLDPFCDCQDSTGLMMVDIRLAPLPSGLQVANVRFKLDNKTSRLRLRLVNTKAGWRVDDVGSVHIPSLRRFLATP